MRKFKITVLLLFLFLIFFTMPVMATGSASLTLPLGTTQSLYCGLYYDDGYNKTWVSSNPSIATVVSYNGAYCDVQLKSVGSCSVTFYTKYKKFEVIDYVNGYPIFGYREYMDSFTYYITVTETGEAVPGTVDIIGDTLELKPGDSSILRVLIRSTEKKLMRNYNKLFWSSSNPAVATVNQIGVVTAWSNGTAVITATTPQGVKDTCTITVDPKADYTTISTAQQLKDISKNLSGKYILTKNIVFSDSDFAPGGTFYNGGSGWMPIEGFTGTLDGNGFYIQNLRCNATNAGLFTKLQGKVCNLEIKDSNISGNGAAGAFFGTGDSMQLINCKSTLNTITGNYAGGIGGNSASYGNCYSCTNTSTVIGSGYSGGIVGYGGFGTNILLCSNKGNVSSNSTGNVGGILGEGGYSSMKYCYNEGTISGKVNAGGLVGLTGTGSDIYVSYNVGKVTGSGTYAYVGGIAGRIYTTFIGDCYNVGPLELNSGSSGLMGGIVGNATDISHYPGDNALMLLNCISNGIMTFTGSGLPRIGGIAGTITGLQSIANETVAKNCYYLSNLAQVGIAWVQYGKTDKIIPLTAAQMKNSGNFSSLDFSSVWVMKSGNSYPILYFKEVVSNVGVIGIPTSLKAESSGYNIINLSWEPSIGASGYEVYRSTSSSGTYTLIGNTTDSNYTNTGLTAGTTYYYKVRGYNTINSTKVYSGYSSVVSAKIEPRNIPVISLIGTNRYDTSVRLSSNQFTISDTVLIVNGGAMADGLGATPLAAFKKAPLLLTDVKSLPEVTINEIKRLKAKNAIIIGGTGVVSDKVESQLRALGLSTERISGKDRYATSLEIAKYIDSKCYDVSKVVISYGHGEADALSIASVAGRDNMPIVLVDKNSIQEDTFDWLKSEELQNAYIIGGTGVVSDNILNKINTITSTDIKNNRLGGQNRFDTNSLVIDKFYGNTIDKIYIAKGYVLIDALAAGPVAALKGAPVVITGDDLSTSQKTVLGKRTGNTILRTGGGISEKAISSLKSCLQ